MLKRQTKTYRRTFARINLGAIEQNVKGLKTCLKPGVKALCVVKADAYGHGSVPVARHLEPLADYFGVASIEEALTLREGGIQKPILILSYTSPSLYPELVQYDLTPAIYDEEQAKILSAVARQMGKRARVHAVVDTGMGRIGFQPDEAGADAVREISQMEGIFLEGLFSHYACADCKDKADALCQTEKFDFFLSLLKERGVEISLCHICNSAGAMEFDRQYDMCRLGIAMYGLYPSDEVDLERVKLTPAMEVISHVVHVKTVPAGFQIGYGHVYTAPSKRKIATVSIGYADGFNRCLTDRGFVLIRGKRAPVVGRVCMDQIMVDVTDIPDVAVEDEAVVLGKSGEEEITAEELGALTYSFNYEVVCNFMPRVIRVYGEED